MDYAGADSDIENDFEQFYLRSLPIDAAAAGDVLLAYEHNGAPIPPQHGFPLRLIVPGWYGMTNVKWLTAITVLHEEFTGYQESNAYRLRQSPDESGEPVTQILPRSLLEPPGIPDFFTRRRVVRAG